MRSLTFIVLLIATVGAVAVAAKPSPADEQNSIVIIFKDGTQKKFPMADIARIEFTTSTIPKTQGTVGQGRFFGKWRVGIGGGTPGTFMITLDRDGQAVKDIGGTHGRWVVLDGEARITWDDGWHDCIRKRGGKYEKAAYGPGKTFTDDPDSIASAEHTEASPI